VNVLVEQVSRIWNVLILAYRVGSYASTSRDSVGGEGQPGQQRLSMSGSEERRSRSDITDKQRSFRVDLRASLGLPDQAVGQFRVDEFEGVSLQFWFVVRLFTHGGDSAPVVQRCTVTSGHISVGPDCGVIATGCSPPRRRTGCCTFLLHIGAVLTLKRSPGPC
jgi:hypothetical protein